MNVINKEPASALPWKEFLTKTYALCYPQHKKSFLRLVALLLLVAVIDVLTFTSVIPVIYLINNPAPIYEHPVLYAIFSGLGFTSTNVFIIFLLVCIAFIFLCKNLLTLFIRNLQTGYIFEVAEHLLRSQYQRFYDATVLDRKSKGAVHYLRYIATASVQFSVALLLPLTFMLYDTFIIILVVGAMLIYSPLVFMLTAVTMLPFTVVLIMLAKRRLAGLSAELGRLEIESYRLALEGIDAYEEIKSFRKETWFTEGIMATFADLFQVQRRIFLLQEVPRRIIEVVVILAIGAIFGTAVFMFRLPVDNLVVLLLAFATAAYRLMPSVNEWLANMVRAKSTAYVFEHLETLPVSVGQDVPAPISFEQQLVWEDVIFAYDSEQKRILDKISVQIPKGSFIILTGESGMGKSTMAEVFAGFIFPAEGRYLVDGVPVTHLQQIRHLVAYVAQDFYLFDKTLAENIAVGETADMMDHNRIAAAIKAARLDTLIYARPEGQQLRIGEQGNKLSGGQRQRIAIARALYKQAQILILDEVTSALDKENEAEILDTIYAVSKELHLTVIMVTHRTASLYNFDRMYKLENGKLLAL